MPFCGNQSPTLEVQLCESRWKLRQSIHRPSRAQESHQQLFYQAGAAVIENKQSLTPTLHRDCGLNKVVLSFMMNSSGLCAAVLQSQDLDGYSLNSAQKRLCVMMCDSLVFTHNTLLPVLARPCLTKVLPESWPGSPEHTSAFRQRKDPSAPHTSLLTAGDRFSYLKNMQNRAFN